MLYPCCALALLQSEYFSINMLNSSLFVFETLLLHSISIQTSSIIRKPLLTSLRLHRGETGKSASSLQARNTMEVSLSEQSLYWYLALAVCILWTYMIFYIFILKLL